MGQVKSVFYFSSVSSSGTSSVGTANGFNFGGKRTFQATQRAAGTSAATCIVQASNDAVNWIPRGTIAIAGTSATVSAGFVVEEAWGYWRVALASVGTSASIDVIGGEEANP